MKFRQNRNIIRLMIIKNLRKNLNLTQKELAAKLNINKSVMNKYENGLVEPSIENLKRIADFFNVSIDSLVEHKTDMLDRKFISANKNKIIDTVLDLTPDEENKMLGFLYKLIDDRKEK